jgi:hypothetical protein
MARRRALEALEANGRDRRVLETTLHLHLLETLHPPR